jgi:Fe-S cluster assembly ATP-binding protein
MALLEIVKLAYRVPTRALLAGLDLSIEAGEVHALIGTNGAGKSTLAYLVMGCEGYRPEQGEIRFAGQRINHLPLFERARLGITLAWQEPARFEGLTVENYLNLGKQPVDVNACLRQVGLSPLIYRHRMVDKHLSGGERKRVELAAVLALNPRLVILDEPTAGIDLISIPEIIDLIRTFKQRGSAVLLITHREELSRVADRASQLAEGRIICSGNPGVVARHYQNQRPSVDHGKEFEHENS